ncbi:MAG: riboflavin synthase [Oscillospiraceae bacterium]|nr:riboflavin synthase [Oscillospiraceae bacterium]
MFTGIIEETGVVTGIRKGIKSCRLTIQGTVIFDDIKLGDSVAVNGVCLTVHAVSEHSFTADVMAETISRTALGVLTLGSKVNLERAMPANGRFGGHIVSGHVDAVGTIVSLIPEDNAVWITATAPPKIMRYLVEKGSVAMDGVSLTVAKTGRDSFQVSIIPHTGENTILLSKKTGDPVNLECDIIGKYVAHLLAPPGPGAGESKITMDFLVKHGF